MQGDFACYQKVPTTYMQEHPCVHVQLSQYGYKCCKYSACSLLQLCFTDAKKYITTCIMSSLQNKLLIVSQYSK